ncbi:hypothetical protein H8D57_03245 [bacterium]|nr:hypothetical protein [bacterium]
MSEHNEYGTEDLAFAAFLRVQGYAITRVEKLNPNEQRSKRTFFFNVTKSQLQELKIKFINSDILRFYNQILGLKKL